ncbi:TrmO family methyltransferase domain-containing protein [Streptomyces lydicamycinicus]
MSEELTVVPVAHVIGGRVEPTDDYWGGTRSVIRIDPERYTEESVVGLEAFSHIEVVFAHRNMRRVNRLGVSRCRLVAVDGLDLHVEALDAVDGTPVLDIKPWFSVMGPQGEVHEPTWPSQMLADYYTTPPT